MSDVELPTHLKGLRACLVCRLVKSSDGFYQTGCENCRHLKMKGERTSVEDYTTNSFEGVIAILDAEQSWVSRWEGLQKKVRGIYAIQVYGEIPEELRNQIQ